MRRRSFLSALAATALARPHVSRAAAQQVLKFIPLADLAVLDPIITTAGITRTHAYAVFDTLYGVTGPEDGFTAKPQSTALTMRWSFKLPLASTKTSATWATHVCPNI